LPLLSIGFEAIAEGLLYNHFVLAPSGASLRFWFSMYCLMLL
jgi:hypothetical protein